MVNDVVNADFKRLVTDKILPVYARIFSVSRGLLLKFFQYILEYFRCPAGYLQKISYPGQGMVDPSVRHHAFGCIVNEGHALLQAMDGGLSLGLKWLVKNRACGIDFKSPSGFKRSEMDRRTSNHRIN